MSELQWYQVGALAFFVGACVFWLIAWWIGLEDKDQGTWSRLSEEAIWCNGDDEKVDHAPPFEDTQADVHTP